MPELDLINSTLSFWLNVSICNLLWSISLFSIVDLLANWLGLPGFWFSEYVVSLNNRILFTSFLGSILLNVLLNLVFFLFLF